MQVPARPPAAAAMAGVTIDALSGGRFIFGFGPSGPQVSEGWYGVPYAKPWGRTREYIEVVREIVAREGPARAPTASTTSCPIEGGDGPGQGAEAQLPPGPQRDPGLRRRDRPQVGRDGGRDLRRLDPDLLLARRVRGDLGRAPRGRLRRRAGAAARTSRSRPSIQVAIDGDLETARDVVKTGLLLYLGGMGSRETNFYVDLTHRFGFGEVADEVQSLYLDGKRERGLRGDPRRARRRDLAGRHRGRGRRAGRAASPRSASTG